MAIDGPTWADMCARDHFVQFYDEDRTIIESVAGYFAFGLRFGEGCVLIGTPAHNTEIVAAMREIGCDVDAAISDGRMKVLDAAETLEQFMSGGMPDKQRFDAVIGKIISGATRDHKVPRAFGEMVDILVQSDNARAAVKLEAMWNEFAARIPLRLFCAYNNDALSRCHGVEVTKEISSSHSQIIGIAPAV